MQIGPLAPRGLLGRCRRLRKRSDFQRVFRRGRRARGAHLAIVVHRTPEADGSRLGLAVSRKSGNAPARARLRRLMREAFRSLHHDLPQPVELVVRTLGPWPEADLAAVHAELGALLVQVMTARRSSRRRRQRPQQPAQPPHQRRSEHAHAAT